MTDLPLRLLILAIAPACILCVTWRLLRGAA